jgi:hypothetical protein
MGGAYHWGLIIHQQRYLPSDRNKNVDIEFSAHDAFLTEPSSGTLNVKRLESQIIY